jgi:hypothetical protein
MAAATGIPVAARRLVHAAAWLVPGALRDDWQREWHGELAAWVAEGRAGATRHGVWCLRRRLLDPPAPGG